jgi:hypothetical protein
MAVLKYYNTTTSAWEYIAASTTANFTSWKKTMSGGETSVSGTDDNAVTLSYTVGLEQVFINGVLQVRGSDYTATTGTSVTGLTALVASDIVTVVCYAPFNVANTIAPTVVDAKGDLLAGTAADTVGRLAVGTNGQLLAADSSTATGLKWANGGLTLIKTESFSAVASHSVNDVFSSTYKNYRVMVDLVGSTSISLSLRVRLSGSDISTSIYNRQSSSANNTSMTAGRATAQSSWLLDDASTDTNIFVMDFFNPADSGKKTQMFCMTGIRSDSATPILINNLFGLNTNSENTGFSLIPNTGTITGSVSVYGYNK